MSLLAYVDTRDATISALKALAETKRKCERLPGEIASIADEIRKLDYSMETRPTARKATKLEMLRVKRAARKLERADLEQYLSQFADCWERLTVEERDALHYRYLDKSARIRDFMVKYHICRSEAFRRSDAALQRFARLLYW